MRSDGAETPSGGEVAGKEEIICRRRAFLRFFPARLSHRQPMATFQVRVEGSPGQGEGRQMGLTLMR
jgi:hypothetical protein